MNKRVWAVIGTILAVGLLVSCLVALNYESAHDADHAAEGGVAIAADQSDLEHQVPPKGAEQFPLNDSFELPFLGKVKCFSRTEEIEFSGGGKTHKWPFKVYYSRTGMPIRAEFKKPGAKDYEFDVETLRIDYQSRVQSLVGFPAKPAKASFAKVLEALYEQEPLDRATKINITWLVWADETESTTHENFIANVWGVSSGIARVPDGDDGFLKYRIVLNSDGEAQFIDNLL